MLEHQHEGVHVVQYRPCALLVQRLIKHTWHSRSTRLTPDVIEGQHGVRDVLDHGQRTQQAPLLQRVYFLPQLRVAIVALLPLLQHEIGVRED